MTSTVVPRIQYVALQNQTVFTFGWEFYPQTASFINVWYTPNGQTASDPADLVSPSNYTVTSASPNGGTVTLLFNPNAGDIITIERYQNETANYSWIDGGPFLASMLTQSYDNIIYMVQWLSMVEQDLTPTYPHSSSPVIGVDTTLPILGPNQIWAKNPGNTGIIPVTIPTGTFTTGTVTEIIAGPGLSASGGTPGGNITTSGTLQVANNGIIFSMMQQYSAVSGVLCGYPPSGTSTNFTPITLGAGFSIVSGALTYTGGGGGGSGTVTSVAAGNGLVTTPGGGITGIGSVSVAPGTANTLAGFNNSGAFGDVTVGSGLTLTGGVLTNTSSSTVTPFRIQKVLNTSRASTTTPTADPELTFNMLANTIYTIEIKIMASIGVSEGYSYGTSGPTGYSTLFIHFIEDRGAGANANFFSSYGTMSVTTGTINPGFYTDIFMIVQNGATAGTFAYVWSPAISNATPTITLAGSYLQYSHN